MKRIISLTLITILILSVIPIGFGQSGFTYPPNYDPEKGGDFNFNSKDYYYNSYSNTLKDLNCAGDCSNEMDQCYNDCQEAEENNRKLCDDIRDKCYSMFENYGGSEVWSADEYYQCLEDEKYEDCQSRIVYWRHCADSKKCSEDCNEKCSIPNWIKGEPSDLIDQPEEVNCEKIENDLTGGLQDLNTPEEVEKMKGDFQQFTTALLDIINIANKGTVTKNQIDNALNALFTNYYPDTGNFLNTLSNIQDSGIDVPGNLDWEYLKERANNADDTISVFNLAMNMWKTGELGNIGSDVELQQFLSNLGRKIENPEGPISLDQMIKSSLDEAKRDVPFSYTLEDSSDYLAAVSVEKYKQNNDFEYFFDDKDPIYEAMNNPEFVQTMKRYDDINNGRIEGTQEEQLTAMFAIMLPGIGDVDTVNSATLAFDDGRYVVGSLYTGLLALPAFIKGFKSLTKLPKLGAVAKLLGREAQIIEKDAIRAAEQAGKNSIFSLFDPTLKESSGVAKAAKCFDNIEDVIAKRLEDARNALPNIPKEYISLDKNLNPVINLYGPEIERAIKNNHCLLRRSCEVTPNQFKALSRRAVQKGLTMEQIANMVRIEERNGIKMLTLVEDIPTSRPIKIEPKAPPPLSRSEIIAQKIENNKLQLRGQLNNRVNSRLYKYSKSDAALELFGDPDITNIEKHIDDIANGRKTINADYLSPSGKRYPGGIKKFLSELSSN